MLEKLTRLMESNRVVVLSGPNGSGKSTLLKALEHKLFAEGIRFGTLSQHEEPFEELNFEQLLRLTGRTEAAQLGEAFGLSASYSKPLAILSSGERAKVMLCFALTFEIVILDEPFAHLDKQSRSLLELFIEESKSRFVIANHERIKIRSTATLTLKPRE